MGGASGSKRGTSQFVVRAGFVRLRGRFGQTDIAIAGCTGGGMVDLLNAAIIVAGQALRVNILGVGGSSLGQKKTTSRWRSTVGERESSQI
jgi:hypothetical protein